MLTAMIFTSEFDFAALSKDSAAHHCCSCLSIVYYLYVIELYAFADLTPLSNTFIFLLGFAHAENLYDSRRPIDICSATTIISSHSQHIVLPTFIKNCNHYYSK